MKNLDVTQSFFSDFEFLLAKLKEVHPDPFTHISEKRFVSSAYKRIVLCDSRLSFFKVLSKHLALLKDAHTSVGLPIKDSARLPKYDIHIEKGKAGVWLLNVNNISVAKQKILSINEMPIHVFWKEARKLISAEKNAYSNTLLEKHFNYFLSLYFEKQTVQLQLEQESITLEPQSGKGFQTKAQNYSLSFQNDLAIIEINNFLDWEQASLFFAEAFRELKEKKTKRLVIDIRNNSGGNSAIAAELISYFYAKKMKLYEKSIVRYSHTRWAFYQQCDWLNDIKAKDAAFYKSLISKKNFGKNITEREAETRTPKRQNFFNGDVYLLTSNYTFSAAADLAWAFKHYNMGKIIGEETGGNGVSFGDTISITLPNTGLQAYLSHKKIYCVGANEQSTHGAKPDKRTKAKEVLPLLNKLILGKT